MLRLPGQALRLGVAHDSLALVRTSSVFGARREVLAETRIDAPEPAILARALDTLLAQAKPAGWPLTVVLADELARMWRVVPPPQAASPADLEAAVAMRFASLFGGPPGGWTMSADWQATRPFLAAALPTPLLDALVQAARAARCHLVEVVPQLVAALNGWRRLRTSGAWFALVHGQVLTLAAYDALQLVALRTAVVPPGAGSSWFEHQIAREALRIGVAVPHRVQVGGAAPRGWAGVAGPGTFACTLFEDDAAGDAGAVRLACTGCAA